MIRASPSCVLLTKISLLLFCELRSVFKSHDTVFDGCGVYYAVCRSKRHRVSADSVSTIKALTLVCCHHGPVGIQRYSTAT